MKLPGGRGVPNREHAALFGKPARDREQVALGNQHGAGHLTWGQRQHGLQSAVVGRPDPHFAGLHAAGIRLSGKILFLPGGERRIIGQSAIREPQVEVRGRESLAVAGGGHRHDDVGQAGQPVSKLSGWQIDDIHRSVATATGHHLPIRRHGDRRHLVAVRP